MVSLGAVMVEIETDASALDGFGTILDADMKNDLPAYIKGYGNKNLPYESIKDIMNFNLKDTLRSIPYGHGRFAGILKDTTSAEALTKLKARVRKNGIQFFEKHLQQHQLDIILSVNNRHAGYAAAANYPCLTVAMGYRSNGEPAGITFIARPWQEMLLLKTGYAFEQATQERKTPTVYQ